MVLTWLLMLLTLPPPTAPVCSFHMARVVPRVEMADAAASNSTAPPGPSSSSPLLLSSESDSASFCVLIQNGERGRSPATGEGERDRVAVDCLEEDNDVDDEGNEHKDDEDDEDDEDEEGNEDAEANEDLEARKAETEE